MIAHLRKSTLYALGISAALHVAVAFSFYSPAQDFLNRSFVPIKIRAASTKPLKGNAGELASAATPKPKSKRKSAPSLEKKFAAKDSQPTASKLDQVNDSETAQENEGDANASPGTPDGAVDGGLGAHDASLVRSSFRQPEYTRAAAFAGYETEVIAEILVKRDGSVSEVKLGEPLLYGMEQRLIHSIKHAQFLAAKNQQGEEVEGWTRIRFKLVIPR